MTMIGDVNITMKGSRFRAMCIDHEFASFLVGSLHRPSLYLGGVMDRLIELRDGITKSNLGSIPNTSTSIILRYVM